MKRNLLRTLQLLLWSIALAGLSLAQAQGPATGTPAFNSFAGEPDTVNLGNLNVHFAVPIMRKAGRGMPFTYDLSYDSSVWYSTPVAGVPTWQPVSLYGWRGQTEVAVGYVTHATHKGSQCPPGDGGFITFFDTYVFHDMFGVSHPFSGSAVVDCNSNSTGFTSPRSADGSGYNIVVANDTLAVTVYSAAGAYKVPPQNVPTGAGTATDANGNRISVNGTGVFTDTLGTAALTISGGAPNPLNFAYKSPSGSSPSYKVNYVTRNIKTQFGCSGIMEYSATGVSLVSSITLPDNSGSYSFTYETTLGPGNSGYTTGRIASIGLPTGGTISYTYSGGSGDPNHNAITCSDGSTAGMTRGVNPGTLSQPSGTWTYARTGSGNSWTTSITDPQLNQTTINFAKDSTAKTSNFYETQRQVYQGSSSLLLTTITCYNGNFASCASATVASPISQTDNYRQWPSGGISVSEKQYNLFGLLTDSKEFNYGAAINSPPSASLILSHTTIAYDTSLGNIVDHPAIITVTDSNSNILAKTIYNYDEYGTYPLQSTSGTPSHISVTGSRGNLTSVTSYRSTSSALVKHFGYFDTGTVYQAYDVNGAITTYVYGTAAQGSSTISCGNSFPTSINLPVNSLSTSTSWNCDGGVATQTKDANLQPTNITYSNAFYWRPDAIQDPALNTTTFGYTNTTTESSMTFNGNSAIAEQLTTVDGLGRVVLSQRQQGVGSSTYDSSQQNYDSLGRAIEGTMPYSGTAKQTTSTTPKTSAAYDALGRPTTVSDAGSGSVAYTYSKNDVLQVVGPAPTGERVKQKQLEYDGMGRLTSVCEITAGNTIGPAGSCTQQTPIPAPPGTGYMTTYAYASVSGLNQVTVTQNAQSAPTQVRTYVYDLLGRLVSEKNPETGNATTTYTYDVATGCSGTFNGDLVKRVDPQGNTACYTYDGLHRVTSISYSGPNTTPTKSFVYDSATVNGVAMANAKGHLAEAYTGPSGAKLTDLGFVYSVRGELLETWESTPNSGGYYHPTASYWANGGLNTLWMSGLPVLTYGVDSEGRPGAVSASSGRNPVSAVTYATSGTSQPIGALTKVTFGSGASDNFTYDTNTGRMTQFKYTVAASSEVGNLGWNPNGSLASLGITDPFNSSNTQNCTYVHDDLARIQSASCGSTWGQAYSLDAFGNASKSVLSGSTGYAWAASYNGNNQYSSLPGFTPTYDVNGDLLTDSFHTYTWDAEGKMTKLDTTVLTYDALGRMAEQNPSAGNYFQVVYSPLGTKLAIMKAQVIQQAFLPLPGGATAEYLSWGLSHYRHPDWLGSARMESSTSNAILQDTAYDAFGVPYSGLAGGNGELSFTGQNKDTAWLDYDFLAREYDPKQGRWLSPDPAGLTAVDPANPQSLNRYAYVGNSPLNGIDPLGLQGGCYQDKKGTWQCPGQTTTVYALPLPCLTCDSSFYYDLMYGGGNWLIVSGQINGTSSGSSNPPANNPPAPSNRQATCSAKIQASVQSNLNPTSVTNLGPTSGPGMDSSGMRGGAYNVNFFVTGVPFGPTGTASAVPGTTCGRFSDGLHIPIPGAPGCPNLNDPTKFTGQPSVLNGASGFYFTAHIDSGNANTFWGSVNHIIVDVILGNFGYHHGC